jgi:site-specific DNA-cytosine methylase
VKPLCIDLFCGLGGWTEGFLSEGFDVIGFDIEEHVYGEHRYPAQLVLQDVRTLHGSQFKGADIIVASSPCQEFSYRAMPWKRAKALGPPELGMELFAQAGRIQREACEASGRYIPMIQENVKGAQKYVGRAQWHYGSYYLWGDVPALMPIALRAQKANPDGTAHPPGSWFAIADSKNRGERKSSVGSWDPTRPNYTPDHSWATKNSGGSWFNIGSPGQKVTNQNPVHDGVKQSGLSGMRANGKGDRWFQDGAAASGSKSNARKAASARIAKIPFPLAQWIARVTREARKVA